MSTSHEPRPVIAIHGGCGTLRRDLLDDAGWVQLREHLEQSLRSGWAILARGGSAVDAVEAAVVVLEDSPHFNAGHGAALTEDGTHELDASIMNGADMMAGAVCGVKHVRNPVRAARMVMEQSDCVLIAGEAADKFASRCGLSLVDNRYFTTARRLSALADLKEREARGTIGAASEAQRHGTVGAVALDAAGNLAAATSTGGFNNKPVGRVGDSPIIGAGTYASNGFAAVSCTGQGEVFIRESVAHELIARMRHAGQSLEQAARALIAEDLAPYRLGAGLVAVDGAGNIVAPFNTLGMARGWIDRDGTLQVGHHAEMHFAGRVRMEAQRQA